MRFRIRVPLAIVGALLVVVALEGPAFAQESNPNFADKASEEKSAVVD